MPILPPFAPSRRRRTARCGGRAPARGIEAAKACTKALAVAAVAVGSTVVSADDLRVSQGSVRLRGSVVQLNLPVPPNQAYAGTYGVTAPTFDEIIDSDGHDEPILHLYHHSLVDSFDFHLRGGATRRFDVDIDLGKLIGAETRVTGFTSAQLNSLGPGRIRGVTANLEAVFVPVPEPASVALLAAGLVGLAGRKSLWRRLARPLARDVTHAPA